MREANAARIFTVALATAGLSACSSSVDTQGQGGTTTTTGSTAGSGGATTGSTTSTTTTSSDSIIADALPPPLECSVVADGHTLLPTADLAGTTLTVHLEFDYGSGQYATGWSGSPQASASTGLGVVDKVEAAGTSLTITIALAAGSTGGTLTLGADLGGFSGPPDYGPITCPVTRTFTIDLTGSSPQIARNTLPAPIEQRPRLVLTLLGADGLHAKVRASGVPEGAVVELDTTGGVARREGGLVDWALPPEAGLYQLEVVVRRGGSIATSALAVEVKEDSG